MTHIEELIYGLGHQFEALRLEIRAASRRHDQEGDEASMYEFKADAEAARALPAIDNPLNRKEGAE